MDDKERAVQLHQQLLELRNWETACQTKTALEESEARLRAFFEYSPIGLCLLDTELRFVAVNERLAAFNDLTLAAFPGRTVREMLGDMGEKIEPLLLQVLSSGQPVLNVELVGNTPHQPGEFGHWFVSCFPIAGQEQQPLALAAVIIDVTEFKQTEIALKTGVEQPEELLKAQVHYQEVLARCSRTLLRPIVTVADQQQILDEALEHLREGTRARRVALFENFYDPEQGLCGQYLAEATGPGAGSYRERPQLQVIPWGEISQKVRRRLEAGKPWSGSSLELFVNLPAVSAVADTVSNLLFPIHSGGYWWGVICFGDCAVEGIWANHEQLLRTASEMIGQFLQRRQINTDLRQRVKELSALNLIAQTMATVTELSIALNMVADIVSRLFEAFSTAISLLDEDGTELKVVAHSQARPDGRGVVGLVFSPPTHEPTLGRVLQQRRPLVISQAQTNPLIQRLYLPGQVSEVRHLLLVPLLTRGRVIGILSISLDRAGRRFTSSEISLAETVASQVGSAIETVRLFARERRERRMAESLREVATSLNSTLDREIVLDTLFKQLGRVIHHNGGSIFLLDGDDLVLASGAGSSKRLIGRRISLGSADPTVRIFVEKRPYIVANTSIEPGWDTWERPQPVLSWMGAPLLLGSEPIGVLGVYDCVPNAYSWEDAETLLAFANQAATAIQNARLYEQTQQDAVAKTELLQEVNHRVKNNLMAIRGLLLVERSHASAEGRVYVTELLESLDQRIQGLVKVHDVLSRSQWGPVSLQDLAGQIIQEAMKATILDRPIRLEVAPSPVIVSPRQASSLALVINELATNTIKYAQPVSNITVSISAEDNMIQLEYRDNGPGYPDEVLHQEYGAGVAPVGSGKGLYLLQRIVAGTLQGRVTIANQAGALVRVQFKAEADNAV